MRPITKGQRSARLAGIAVALIAAASYAHSARGDAQPDSFQAAMDAAMARMDAEMAAPATGDSDRDFAAMMIPHHQGAIDMAEAELRFGHDPVLRRLAQGIIVEQGQEIAVMRQALAALPPTPAAPPGALARPAHQR
jgi:uncharacterized protein (DUF305 family)